MSQKMSHSTESCLASVLDKIDQSLAAGGGKAETTPSSSTINATQVWYEYFDQTRKAPYYHNYVLNKTQWEKPEDCDIIPVAPQSQIISSSSPFVAGSSDQTGYEHEGNEAAVAYFSKTTGKFSHAGSNSYWKKIGREEDKAGRQLGIFMDLSTLEANREEAKRMKEEAQKKRGHIDWAAYKEEKKSLKKRKHQSWVYEP